MNMDRLINIVMVFVFLGLVVTASPLKAQTEYFNIFAQMPWPEKESLQEILEDVWATYPHAKWVGPFPDNVHGHVALWDKYRDAVIYILENDQELRSHGYIMTYYLKRLSPEAWEKDGFPQVTKFLIKTEGREDLREARNQALETLFFRATEQQIGKYLRKPADRKLVQDYLTSIWTRDALMELKIFLKEIEENIEKNKDLIPVKQELEESIATIVERRTYATLPREEISQDYFEQEGKRQFEEVREMIRRCFKWDQQVPPDYRDGADHVIKYWSNYRLGAYYLLENVPNGELHLEYVVCALCPNITEETTNILKKLLEKCELNPKCNNSQMGKAGLIRCYIHRIGVDELNQRFQSYLFEYGNGLFPDLPDRYGLIGNEKSLEILKKARKFYSEKDLDSCVDLMTKNIEAIEKRLKIIPVHGKME